MAANVARGAKWLDGINPHWFLQISTTELNLADTDSCICGQIFCEDALATAVEDDEGYVCYYDNGYEFALAQYFDGQEMEVIKHGFQALTSYSYRSDEDNLGQILDSAFYSNPPRQYEFLAYEWIIQINSRIDSYSKD
jgi:hypothetical protein